MKTTAIITFSLLACIYGATLVESSCNALSTAKIIGKLCYVGNNKSNQSLVDGFAGCYEGVEGKQQFLDCQTEAFGAPMDSVSTVSAACRQLTKVPAYSSCLKRVFAAANIDLDAAVEKVNACQSKVMGIGPSLLCSGN